MRDITKLERVAIDSFLAGIRKEGFTPGTVLRGRDIVSIVKAHPMLPKLKDLDMLREQAFALGEVEAQIFRAKRNLRLDNRKTETTIITILDNEKEEE